MVVWSTVSFCSAPKKVDNSSCTIDDLTTHLQKVIKKYKNVDDISVTDILEDATVKVVGHAVYEKAEKFSEDLVEYTNECDKDAKFIHTWKTNQKSSSTVQTSKGHSFRISGGPGFNAFGGSVALSGGYTYSRCKTHQQNKGQGESESSTVEVTVGKGETIVIKEMLYEVEKQADCTLELVLEVGQKIEFKKKKKADKVKVRNKDFENFEWARIERDLIFCTFTGKCCFHTTQRRVISSKADNILK